MIDGPHALGPATHIPQSILGQNERREMKAWQCETCGAVYAEYVNGCPKCWNGDPPKMPQPEVRSKVICVEIPSTREAAHD
jgi:hypothetical protein